MIRLAVGAAILSSAMLAVGACGNSQFDGAPSTSDAQADDATSDVHAPDASPITDSGPPPLKLDAAPITPIECFDGGDGGGDSGHTICDAFEGPKLANFWNVNAACAAPVLDVTTFVSPPSSLATTDVTTPVNCASIYASVSSPASSKFSTSFDVYLDSETSKLAPFFAIWVTTTDYPFYEVALTTDSTGKINVLENLTFVDGGPGFDVTPVNAAIITPSAWNKVSLTINFEGPNIVAVSLGDNTPLTLPLQHRPSPGSISGYRVYLGIPNGGDTKAAAHFDDFVCDVTP
jgi:hypothetical protein